MCSIFSVPIWSHFKCCCWCHGNYTSIWMLSFVQNHEVNWSCSLADKRILSEIYIFFFKMPQSLNKGAKRVNKNSCGEPTWYGSVCEKERNFVFTDSAKCSSTTWIFHAQFSHESVDTVVSAAQLRMWEDQNSIPIITLPIYYLFSGLWGINNETCTLCESWPSRCLFNLGSTAQYQPYIWWSKNATLNQNTRRETESVTRKNLIGLKQSHKGQRSPGQADSDPMRSY